MAKFLQLIYNLMEPFFFERNRLQRVLLLEESLLFLLDLNPQHFIILFGAVVLLHHFDNLEPQAGGLFLQFRFGTALHCFGLCLKSAYFLVQSYQLLSQSLRLLLNLRALKSESRQVGISVLDLSSDILDPLAQLLPHMVLVAMFPASLLKLTSSALQLLLHCLQALHFLSISSLNLHQLLLQSLTLLPLGLQHLSKLFSLLPQKAEFVLEFGGRRDWDGDGLRGLFDHSDLSLQSSDSRMPQIHSNNQLIPIYQFFYMESTCRTGLRIKNSLTGLLEEFVPLLPRRVKWYVCGPTVYSHTHLGHARNYVSSDMMRRVLEQHFGYTVTYCMNVTNIDDKIIKGSEASQQDYFQFASRWESQFFGDMSKLGNRYPNVVVRVDEYVPQIIQYINKIISLGYAYASNGSVYFDLEAYSKVYPTNRLQLNLTDNIQSALQGFDLEKKSKKDFVLWKNAKPKEPSWDSPWGKGRPGWHIQCSVMSHHVLGPRFDIHSGGSDLKFPHHENQIAQCCAHNESKQWSNYFIHTGHLNIQGLKMSKSLKNFLTVKEILQMQSVSVIRLYIAMHRYDSIMNFSVQNSFGQAKSKDKKFREYFRMAEYRLQTLSLKADFKFRQDEANVFKAVESTQIAVDQHFKNNFDFPGSIQKVDNLISILNSYLQKDPKYYAVKHSFDFVNKFFKTLGIHYQIQKGGNGQDRLKLVKIFSQYRDKVRQAAAAKDFSKIFQANDRVRDHELVSLGIKIQDRKIGQPAVWKVMDPIQLINQKKKEQQQKKAKLQAKLKAQQEQQRRQAEKLKKMQIKPEQLYREQQKYSEWDQKGIPVRDKEGKSLNEKQRKKLQKGWQEQRQLHEKWKSTQEQK